jgi:hypothetical protein
VQSYPLLDEGEPSFCRRVLDKLNVKLGPSDYVLRYSVGARRPIPEVASAEYDAIIDMVIAAHR